MRPSTAVIISVSIALAATVLGPWPAPAQLSEEQERQRRQITPEEAVLIKASRDMNVIAFQARMSMTRGQTVLDLLSQPTPENIFSASRLSLQAYRLARAAHENMLYRKAGIKFPDPLLDMATEKVGQARRTLDTIDKILDGGMTQDPQRINAAIESLNVALTILENALVLLP